MLYQCMTLVAVVFRKEIPLRKTTGESLPWPSASWRVFKKSLGIRRVSEALWGRKAHHSHGILYARECRKVQGLLWSRFVNLQSDWEWDQHARPPTLPRLGSDNDRVPLTQWQTQTQTRAQAPVAAVTWPSALLTLYNSQKGPRPSDRGHRGPCSDSLSHRLAGHSRTYLGVDLRP